MTKNHLAIPAVILGLLSAYYPTRGQILTQNTPVPPPPQVTNASTAPAPQPLTGEDLARLLLARKQFREAQDIFHELTVEHPKNAIYWNELGISYHNQAMLGAALKCYERSMKVDPKYADAMNNAATVWYERKKYAKAIRIYKHAIELRDNYASFYMNIGYAYFNEKDYEDSIASFRKALQIDPTVFDPNRSHVGSVVQDRSLSSDRAKFYFLLAKSFAESGNIERCALYLRKARDEGYKELAAVKTDPSFASVIADPDIQEALTPKPSEAATQP